MSQCDRDRVVITGIGLVTPFAADRETSWRFLRTGARATRWLDDAELAAGGFGGRSREPRVGRHHVERDGDFGLHHAERDGGFVAARYAGAPAACDALTSHTGEPLAGDPVVSLALKAAGEAVADAGLDFDPLNRERLGCVIGTSKGGLRSFTRAWRMRRQSPAAEFPPQLWRQFLPNAPAVAVAQTFGLRGPSLCPVAACATGLLSLVRGAELIRDGYCDLVLAGSTDASLQPALLASFRRLGVLAHGFDDPAAACRPFDRDRSGFLVGEGAAVLVMERLESAAERGVRPYAEWLAAGTATDVTGLTQLEEQPTVLVRLIQDVLSRAELTAGELDYVNLHGTATRQNDLCETRALKAALGPPANRLACSSLKGAIGHLLGAAGSVEMAATLLAMRDGIVPPTANLQTSDAECDLDYTPRESRPKQIDHALKLSLGFGGHLVAAVVRKVEGGRSKIDRFSSVR